MYFSDTLRILARRWRILLIGALVSVAGAAAAFAAVPTDYQASGQVLFIPPSAPQIVGQDTNPYISLPGGLTLTARLVATSVVSPDIQRVLVDDGLDSSYFAAVIPGTGPLIDIVVKDVDPELALRVRDRVIAEIEAELLAIQQHERISPRYFIEPRRFVVTSQAEVIAGARLRAVAIIGALGAVLTIMLIFAVDRRSSRRTRDEQPPDAAPTDESGGEPVAGEQPAEPEAEAEDQSGTGHPRLALPRRPRSSRSTRAPAESSNRAS